MPRTIRTSLLLLLAAPLMACAEQEAAAHVEPAGAAVSSDAGRPARRATDAVSFTAAELDAYARGRARESALVRAARERGRSAGTPQERAAAAQAEWPESTMADAASAAGLSEARYRTLRDDVDRVLETLDFQGKIDGPLEVNLESANPQLRARLTADPYAELTPAAAELLRARLPELVALWNDYMGLVALNG